MSALSPTPAASEAYPKTSPRFHRSHTLNVRAPRDPLEQRWAMTAGALRDDVEAGVSADLQPRWAFPEPQGPAPAPAGEKHARSHTLNLRAPRDPLEQRWAMTAGALRDDVEAGVFADPQPR